MIDLLEKEIALKDKVKIFNTDEINRFCEEYGIKEAFHIYVNETCRVFEDATLITISLTSDPEIENREKINLNISFKSNSDFETIMKLDKELFWSINSAIPGKENNYFVKTYDIVE